MSYHDLATAIFPAVKPEKPLFLEGEAGVGKTEVAKVLSQGLARICNNPERASLR
jgi:MoxR-like ATPase